MDVERTIEFLLAQQARFAERQARFDEQQARLAEQQVRFAEQLGEQQARFDEQHAQSASEMAELRAVVLDLADTQTRTNEILVTLAERHVELAAQQKITEQNLNALITTVERHISGHD